MPQTIVDCSSSLSFMPIKFPILHGTVKLDLWSTLHRKVYRYFIRETMLEMRVGIKGVWGVLLSEVGG